MADAFEHSLESSTDEIVGTTDSAYKRLQLEEPSWNPLAFVGAALEAKQRLRRAKLQLAEEYVVGKTFDDAVAIASENDIEVDRQSIIEDAENQAGKTTKAEENFGNLYVALQGMLPGLETIANSDFYGHDHQSLGELIRPPITD